MDRDLVVAVNDVMEMAEGGGGVAVFEENPQNMFSEETRCRGICSCNFCWNTFKKKEKVDEMNGAY